MADQGLVLSASIPDELCVKSQSVPMPIGT